MKKVCRCGHEEHLHRAYQGALGRSYSYCKADGCKCATYQQGYVDRQKDKS